jgi:nucleoside-diphosphate-sugar epimerase
VPLNCRDGHGGQTDASRFIGSHLTETLMEMGKRVIVFANLTSGFEHNLSQDAELYRGNIRQYTEVQPALEGIEGDSAPKRENLGTTVPHSPFCCHKTHPPCRAEQTCYS